MSTCYSAEVAAKLLAGVESRRAKTLVTTYPSKNEIEDIRWGNGLVVPLPNLADILERSQPKPPRITKPPKNATVFDSWLTALIWANAMSRTRRCHVRKIDGRWMAWRDAA